MKPNQNVSTASFDIAADSSNHYHGTTRVIRGIVHYVLTKVNDLKRWANVCVRGRYDSMPPSSRRIC